MKSNFRKNESGQAMAEFALVLPILLLIVCGILDFGWYFFNQLSLDNACRDVARYTIVHPNSNESEIETILDGIDNHAIVANVESRIKIERFNAAVNTADAENVLGSEIKVTRTRTPLPEEGGDSGKADYTIVITRKSSAELDNYITVDMQIPVTSLTPIMCAIKRSKYYVLTSSVTMRVETVDVIPTTT